MAFIVDVRRGNLQLHLMYKALFELSSDRADFIFRLFSRKRPDGLDCQGDGRRDLHALSRRRRDRRGGGGDRLYKQNLKLVQDHLTRTRHLPLTPDDLKGIEYVYGTVLTGTARGSRTGRSRRPRRFRDAPTYWDLMVADDGKGQYRSFLVERRELHGA